MSQNESQLLDSLNISESVNPMMVQSDNLSQLLTNDYFSKFKQGQNLYEFSMTASRISQGEKTLDDLGDTTQVKAIYCQERLVNEIAKNQQLENMVQSLRTQLSNSMDHNKVLMQQIENQQKSISAAQNKQQKLTKNLEIEKILNTQLMKKLQDQQQVIKYYVDLFRSQQQQINLNQQTKEIPTVLEPKSKYSSAKQPNSVGHQKSYQSISSAKLPGKAMTEDSTYKDTSNSEIRSIDNTSQSNKKRFGDFDIKLSQTAQNFWNSTPTKMMTVHKTHLEKRIEATLAQIRTIKSQFRVYNS